MSKIPAFSRSLASVSLKIFKNSAVFGSLPAGLNSATARRTRSTPRLVPVRIQSCWAANNGAEIVKQHKRAKSARLLFTKFLCVLCVEDFHFLYSNQNSTETRLPE